MLEAVKLNNMSFGNKTSDFKISKGTPLVGALKVEKVDKKKVTAQIPNAPLVRDDNFGNMGIAPKKKRMSFDY